MITIRRIHRSEFYNYIIYDEINISLKKQMDSNTKKEYFAVIDGEQVLGHASLVLLPNILTAQIDEIYILPEIRNQGLGDGLLRTILNYLRINLYTSAVIKGNPDLHEFLISKGIKEINYDILSTQIRDELKIDSLANYYICNIETFFNTECKGSKLI